MKERGFIYRSAGLIRKPWFRVSGLVSDTGGVTEWIKNYGGHDYIVHRSLRTDQ